MYDTSQRCTDTTPLGLVDDLSSLPSDRSPDRSCHRSFVDVKPSTRVGRYFAHNDFHPTVKQATSTIPPSLVHHSSTPSTCIDFHLSPSPPPSSLSHTPLFYRRSPIPPLSHQLFVIILPKTIDRPPNSTTNRTVVHAHPAASRVHV